MLFNSYGFIFIFLPVVLFTFYGIGTRGHHRVAIAWLVISSLFFYGWWKPEYLGLILFSMLFNYAIGVLLGSRMNQADEGKSLNRRLVLTLGVSANLGLLGYYKYANFFVDNINLYFGDVLILQTVILPLAISFFTFQQIAYLVDAYKLETREYNFLHYCLFVTFFPQLIAGPIVHHKEMLPQFSGDRIYRLNHENLAVGLTIFAAGLFKKVVLADGIAVYASPVFGAAEQGVALTFFEAWGGALAYTFQLYFDFSGYSDMAIGIARMFGIRLPLNFNSPYKAVNIIDFWRRWHITLSRFLRDYLYISLGGNRKGKTRRYINLILTMVLGGLWHGAGWTFVLWGALHGLYITINHGWHAVLRLSGRDLNQSTAWGRGASRLLTFLAVVIAWVFFRAESFPGAISILQGMSGLNGIVLPENYLGYLNRLSGLGNILADQGWSFMHMQYFSGIYEVISLLALFLLSFYAPSTQQIMLQFKPAFEVYSGEIKAWSIPWFQWRPTTPWALGIGLVALVSILSLTRVSEFLYFQF